jgi:hypothetical protein
MLVAGGGGSGSPALASAELYDTTTGTWTLTDSLANARGSHTATLLPNGKVLVAGGYDGVALASAELHTPPTEGDGSCTRPPAGLVSWWSGDRIAADVEAKILANW